MLFTKNWKNWKVEIWGVFTQKRAKKSIDRDESWFWSINIDCQILVITVEREVRIKKTEILNGIWDPNRQIWLIILIRIGDCNIYERFRLLKDEFIK